MSKKANYVNIKEDAQTECMVKLKGIDLHTYELYEAIQANDLEGAAKAIENKANVNSLCKPCCQDNDTPLECAAFWANSYNCSTQMIELLKIAGANLYDPEKIKFIENAEKCLLDKTIRKKSFKV